MKILFLLIVILGIHTDMPSQETTLVDIESLGGTYSYEVRYATTNNFLDQIVYDCVQCLLIPEVAKALSAANHDFCEMGYQIKIYDCYRPLSVQKKMWEIYPNPRYVGNPYGSGSIHNRGAAIDMTIITLDGQALDMGSDYDHFGKEAHLNYPHADTIQNNRALLWDIMKKNGFSPISSEWWHFNYDAKNYGLKVLDVDFNCD